MKWLHLFAILTLSVITCCNSLSISHRSPSLSDPNFPAADAPNYQALVSVKWVKSLLDYQQSGFKTPRPPTYLNNRFVVLEASWGAPATATDDAHGHIPGAVHINTDDLENGSALAIAQP
ncbi:MAG: hypothetical protein O3C21_14980 [Verrucomicrobia bacterium]|nr:hypothetical protein [Verrucomicrobiota bacterium]